MADVQVRYLVTKHDKNGVRRYWQPTKKLIEAGFAVRRLDDDLAKAIAQAEDLNRKLDAWYAGIGPVPILPGSVKALSTAWQRDESFTSLAARTQADHLHYLPMIERWAGRFPVKSLTRKAIKAWIKGIRKSRGDYQAYHATATLRRFLAFCVDEDEITINPALRLKVGAPPARRVIWEDAELDAFCATAHEQGYPSVALGARAMWALAQRPGDIVKMPRNGWDGQRIGIRQSKTGATVLIPPLPELRRELDRLPPVNETLATTLLVEEGTGQPWTLDHFEKTFATIRAAAGLRPGLQARDLRRTGATNLGRAGCTDDEIRAVTGHLTRDVVQVYVVPDSTYADNAIAKLDRARKIAKENKTG